MSSPTLRIGHLYADEMNIYGDRGNILTLSRRASWRGIVADVQPIGRGVSPDLAEYDLLFWGGGQDKDQELVFADAAEHKVDRIKAAVAEGCVVLAVCGGYQLLGSYYVTAEHRRLPGLGLVDLHTVPGTRRNIGNILINVEKLGLDPPTLVGFENHSGKTYLGQGLDPLGTVIRGSGNNGEDGSEGVHAGNIFGTYLHGSLLPKNPHFADLLIERALARQGAVGLVPLDDTAELAAHHAIKQRLGDGGRVTSRGTLDR
jgi:CobQ-like glutamine amidotransferase family enzyme